MSNQVNMLSVDLEEWFVVEILTERYPSEKWDKLPVTVLKNSRRLLELFHRKNVRATWFVLGWIAEKYPDLIKEINDWGHEIGCHSFNHHRVDGMGPEKFRADTTRATEAIAGAGVPLPLGYRAPSWSINDKTPWAFEILADLGYEYDSSIFPIKHDLYGMPDGPREIFQMKFDNGQTLFEVPSSTLNILGKNVPVSGGGYLRHSPYWYSGMMIRRLNRQSRPVMIYVHPWEIDPDLPEIDGLSATQKFRTYGSTLFFKFKLEKLLEEFRFTNIADYINRFARRRIGFER